MGPAVISKGMPARSEGEGEAAEAVGVGEGDGGEAGSVRMEGECGDVVFALGEDLGLAEEEAAGDARGTAGLLDEGRAGWDFREDGARGAFSCLEEEGGFASAPGSDEGGEEVRGGADGGDELAGGIDGGGEAVDLAEGDSGVVARAAEGDAGGVPRQDFVPAIQEHDTAVLGASKALAKDGNPVFLQTSPDTLLPMPNSSSPNPVRNKAAQRVFITGMGMISPMGNDEAAHISSMRAGKTHFREVDFFDVSRQRVRTAGVADLSEKTDTPG